MNEKPVIFEGHGKLEYGIRPHFSDNRSLYNLTKTIILLHFLSKILMPYPLFQFMINK